MHEMNEMLSINISVEYMSKNLLDVLNVIICKGAGIELQSLYKYIISIMTMG